jgi:hypothetical protein
MEQIYITMKRLFLLATVMCINFFLWSQKSIDFYRTAAEEGDAGAQTKLGTQYARAGDYVQSVFWYKRAAIQGNASAQFKLGISYEDGYGVEKDENTALYWYKKAVSGKTDISKNERKFAEQFIKELQKKGFSASRAKIDAVAIRRTLAFIRYPEIPEHTVKQLLDSLNPLFQETNEVSSKYVGQTKNNRPHGFGIKKDASGQTEIALWKNGDIFIGISRLNDTIRIISGGKEHSIQYLHGKILTPGQPDVDISEDVRKTYQYQIISYSNGDRYEGETVDGIRDGYGIYYWKNRRYWFGKWKNGRRNGYGAIFDKNNQFLSTGKWFGNDKQ